MLKLEQGRPTDTSGRLEKEIRVYDFLDKLGVIYDRVDHEALMTMEACEGGRPRAGSYHMQESVFVYGK